MKMKRKYSKYIEHTREGYVFKKSAYTQLTGSEMEQLRNDFNEEYAVGGLYIMHTFHSITALMDRISELERKAVG